MTRTNNKAVIVIDRRTSRSIKRYSKILNESIKDSRIIYFGQSKRLGSLFQKYLVIPFKVCCSKENTVILPSEVYAYLLPFLFFKKSIIICHDLHDIINRDVPNWKKCLLRNQFRLLTLASKVVTISKHTKEDLTVLIGKRHTQKVTVLHNPIEQKWQVIPAMPLKSQAKLSGCRFVLIVGTNAWYKNMDRAIEVLASIKDIKVVKVGTIPEEWNDYLQTIEMLSFTSISDEELKWLYQNAVCLFFPSIHEGFGWPVLEAMACSCPVVSSDRASLKEVGGNAVTYVNPYDIVGMKVAIVKIMNDSDTRDLRIQRGKDRAILFAMGQFQDKLNNLITSTN